MFTEDFRRRLDKGTHTRWARDIEENHLAGLIWAVGEYGLRESLAKTITGQLDEHESEIDPERKDYARARVLLELISNFGRPWNCDGRLKRPGTVMAARMIADMLDKSCQDGQIGRPIFSTVVRGRMELGKYSSWACDIEENRLFVLLSLVGEFGLLTHVIAEQLNRHQSEVFVRIPYARARADLDLISQMVHGSRYTLDEVCYHVTIAKRKAEKYLHVPGDWWTS
jgi:hypothetical protein